MKVELFTKTTPLVIEALLEYKLDIGFVSGAPKEKALEVLRVFDEEVFLVRSKNKPVKNTLLAYKENCAFSTFLHQHVKTHQQELFKTTYFENYETILGCVKEGMGISVLPKSLIKKYAYEKDLSCEVIKEVNLATHLVCRKDCIPVMAEYLKKLCL